MVKILYFITDLGIGGAEKLLLLMLNKLDRAKYFPIVCCLYLRKPAYSCQELLEEIQKLNIKIINLGVKSKLDFSVFLKFYNLLIRERPDIVHTHLFHPNIIGRIAARLANVPVVISTQHYSSAFHGRWGMLLDRLTAPLADRIIAVSEAAKKFCIESEGIAKEKISVIYNGIDLKSSSVEISREDFKRQLSLSNELIIGSIGRLVEIKGYRYLFLAIADIIRYYTNTKFIILGFGPLKYDLIRLANQLHILDKVIFLDPAFEAAKFLLILDIYVLPSLSEGLSITLLEAMAMGKPVVATDVGGNFEVIIDGQNGKLVPPKDPLAISRAILYLLQNRDYAVKLGINAKKRVEEKFNIDKMLKETELIYDSLIAAKSK